MKMIYNKAKTGTIYLAILLMLGGCATTKNQDKETPDWVNGAASHYPASQYLIGRGSAAARIKGHPLEPMVS